MDECKNVNYLLSAFIDNELSQKEQIFVQEHIKRCTSCQKEYESMRNLSFLLKGIKPDSVPSYDSLVAKISDDISSYHEHKDRHSIKPYMIFRHRLFKYLPWGGVVLGGFAMIVFIFIRFTHLNKNATLPTFDNTEYTTLSTYQIDDENLDNELASIYYNGYVFDNHADNTQGKRSI